MKLRQWLLGAAGGAVLGLAAAAVQALPAGGMQGELKLATPPLIEKAHVRCGWRYGVLARHPVPPITRRTPTIILRIRTTTAITARRWGSTGVAAIIVTGKPPPSS